MIKSKLYGNKNTQKALRGILAAAMGAAVLSTLAIFANWTYQRWFKVGVLQSNATSSEGVVLLQQYHQSILVDWDGKELTRWPCSGNFLGNGNFLCHNHLKIFEYDPQGKLVLEYPKNNTLPIHHDVERMPDGSTIFLTRNIELNSQVHPILPVISEAIVKIDPDGQFVSSWRLLDHLESIRSHAPEKLFTTRWSYKEKKKKWSRNRKFYDWSHVNSLLAITEKIATKTPFKTGDIIFGAADLHTIFLIDGETQKITWSYTNPWHRLMHHPTFTDEGNLLLFINGKRLSSKSHRSFIVEIDPYTKKTLRKIEPKLTHFLADSAGSAQKTWDGHYFAAESTSGNVYEFDKGGNVLWHYRNPSYADLSFKQRELANQNPERIKNEAGLIYYRVFKYPKTALKYATSLTKRDNNQVIPR